MTGADTAREVRLAARAVGRAGLAHAYGHVSARLDDDTFLVCAAGPLAHVPVEAPGVVVPVRGQLPTGVLGEVRVHQQIYGRRPDVGGVCRTQPPDVMALSAMRRVPLPRHGFGAYFWPHPALWDDVQLLRDDESARAAAATLGEGRALVLRGNGAVVAGANLQQAVVLSWYLEDAARVELEVLRSGLDAPVFDELTCRGRAVFSGGIVERMWSYLTAGDVEVSGALPVLERTVPK